MELLRASGIRRTYGSLQVLKGIDLEVKKGEVVAIVGPSGAGKSTFLHILGTLDRPEHGEVFIEGVNVFTQKDKELARFRNEKIGFIFQFHNLLAEFTALENVCMPGYINGNVNEKDIHARAKELLELLGLGGRMDHLPSQLSGGEQQRVAVARALLNRPAIVLADEPSGNLDSHNALDLHQLFFKLRDETGQTFIIVTHNEELAEMADRRLVMQDGLMVQHSV
ncbi:lipoprotein-releasing system ATP-binding protein [Dyadobacter sp. BE34]|uniref:Lipoprotein-releasing system ATP-binding protein n=1 Tax=Dyadobacter fermentans TaxID=94254 RepID=A0ABU1R100_9BACT|nr:MULTISPECIES: ABC transporter ATP-binding protein [Dyadobacter]MDR6807088.1 lipoprotein-releasing system ATP-binding protein [Dyadobacter fermentans]MDR7044829.1 lipoprotein-releasing system ATP-binding protein [Dyadobacter sp. BE242]MDR7199435.1 lipoprotein-releasing system ATP-binding protein [Dyadobacter sp. BE34]MDR7217395.1 lipoprotein-releasing system ATP-binding protein [Dyadobacter sp. BE31]MDR7265327.1 lipoprotein-releasing system ATP-binding protein [Dyadobacter sp. BE32]